MEIEKAQEVCGLLAQLRFYTELVQELTVQINQGQPLGCESLSGRRFMVPLEVLPDIRRDYQKMIDLVKSKIEQL